jgi:hypothetical protein
MDMGFSEFFNAIWDILTFKRVEGTKGDLFIHILSFIVGPLLKVPGLFFVFVSFIYGYFFSGSIMLVYRYLAQSRKSKVLVFIFIIFVLWRNIEGINTVRTWTGLWILFYAVGNYLIFKKKRYLLLLFFPPLVHFAYFLLAIPAWFVVFIGSRIPQIAYLFIFLLSFAFNYDSSKARETIESTELGQSRTSYILDENNEKVADGRKLISEKRKAGAWYLRINELGLDRYGFIILVIAVFLTGMHVKYFSFEFSLLNIGMLNISMANYLSFIFAVNSRSGIIGEVFLLSFLVIFLSKRLAYNDQSFAFRNFQKLIYIALIFWIPFLFYKTADMIYYISVFVIAFPFIPWLESTMNISIREFLGYFLPRGK